MSRATGAAWAIAPRRHGRAGVRQEPELDGLLAAGGGVTDQRPMAAISLQHGSRYVNATGFSALIPISYYSPSHLAKSFSLLCPRGPVEQGLSPQLEAA